MEEILKQMEKNMMNVAVAAVISSRSSAQGIAIAEKFGVPVHVYDYKTLGRDVAENQIMKLLEEMNPSAIVLAGFMKILSGDFVQKFANRIINIHPSLLPSFKGGNAIEDAMKFGVKVTGVTIHLVTERVDEGEILFQCPVLIDETETIENLATKIHKIEHKNYWKVINQFLTERA